jgi:hypothetical protein
MATIDAPTNVYKDPASTHKRNQLFLEDGAMTTPPMYDLEHMQWIENHAVKVY